MADDKVALGEPKCQTPECKEKAIRSKKTLCYACYMRQYRKGTTDYTPKARPRLTEHGYIMATATYHPLRAGKGKGSEYQHRVVYYDAHGEGPFQCHWCGVAVTWANMHVDHINGVRTDNHISNLCASCAKCNVTRDRTKCNAAIKNAIGYWYTAFGRTQCVNDWAQEIGISDTAMRTRLKNWPLERALSEPPGPRGPKSRRAPGKCTGK